MRRCERCPGELGAVRGGAELLGPGVRGEGGEGLPLNAGGERDVCEACRRKTGRESMLERMSRSVRKSLAGISCKEKETLQVQGRIGCRTREQGAGGGQRRGATQRSQVIQSSGPAHSPLRKLVELAAPPDFACPPKKLLEPLSLV